MASLLGAGCAEDRLDERDTPFVDAIAVAPPASRPDPAPGPPALPSADRLDILRTSEFGLPVIAIDVTGERFEVELAATNPARMQGLAGRTRLPSGTGMLFVHPDDLHRRYWMKGCLVPMDIAFIDRQGRVVAMHRMPIEPPRRVGETLAEYHGRLDGYPSRRPARYALEVPFGDLDRLGVTLGDTIELPREALDELAAREILGRDPRRRP